MDSSAFDRFLRTAPKAELHVHLRGAIPQAYLVRQFGKYPAQRALEKAPNAHREFFWRFANIRAALDAEAPPELRAARLFEFSSFEQFLATYLFTGYFVRNREDFRGLVEAVLARLRAQGAVYAEVLVSLVEYVDQGVAIEDLLDVLDNSAEGGGLKVRWIADLVRNAGAKRAGEVLSGVIRLRPSSVAGITLGGAENAAPASDFAGVYRRAREHGLRLTVHAGEALGPESVWDALRVLEVERIGHGVRSIEDPALVRELAARRIPLEVCPTSNIRTGVYGSYGEHPLRRLYEAGVEININSDDPAFFGAELVDEYARLPGMGFSQEEIVELMKNGFRHAFLSGAEKESYLRKLQASWDAFANQRPMRTRK